MISSMVEAQSWNHLFSTCKEESVGINSVGHRATNEWHPVKYYRGLVRIADQQLFKDIENDCKRDEREYTRSNNDGGGFIRQQVAQRLGDSCKESHGERR